MNETTRITSESLWRIPADASLQSIFEAPECPLLLRQTLTGPISWQVRNEMSVRRALTSRRAAPHWVAALLALGARVTLEDADADDAAVSLNDFLQRKITGRIEALHAPTGGVRWGAAHVARTPADDPIVAAVAGVILENDRVQEARIALTGVWADPVRLAQAAAHLIGAPLDETHIHAAAEAVAQEVTPQSDFLGSETYRRAMASVLTRRALEQCQHQE
jgi:CO/xanthine dehydrogenase FAD-binding subunit